MHTDELATVFRAGSIGPIRREIVFEPLAEPGNPGPPGPPEPPEPVRPSEPARPAEPVVAPS